MAIELTYEEMRVLRRALGSRSMILEDRIENARDEDSKEKASAESKVVDALYIKLAHGLAKAKAEEV